MVKAGSQGLGLQAMAKDLGVDAKVRVQGDATAAKGIASRKGLGQVKHIEVNQLWLQDRVGKGDLDITKIPREINVSDQMTKDPTGPEIEKFMVGTGLEWRGGRHELAPVYERKDGDV